MSNKDLFESLVNAIYTFICMLTTFGGLVCCNVGCLISVPLPVGSLFDILKVQCRRFSPSRCLTRALA